jgi:type I restriction enzyme M protein
MSNASELQNLIWQIADLLRGPYRPPQYERVMLPITVLRRFDCVLADTRQAVRDVRDRHEGRMDGEALEAVLNKATTGADGKAERFHNKSDFDFERLLGDSANIAEHLVSYIKGFSKNVRDIFEYFEFEDEIRKMDEANILFLVVSRMAAVDLHPRRVGNDEMGMIFEELIRKFNEAANETAGDHFTPREIVRLMVNLLFINDDELLATKGTVRKLLDPACGTGGMLAEAQHYLASHHPAAKLYVFGQDYNKRAFATAASDMLMKRVDQNGGTNNIRYGDIFTEDQFTQAPYDRFDYLLANPPFGVDWKKQKKKVEDEHRLNGFDGRFGAGLPRVNDGSLLFLQHMVSKFETVDVSQQRNGSRLAIVLSGSPLFTGGAGSGESEIRRWIIENDMLDAIIALPEAMFYNTGIGTYIWIVTNRKHHDRRGRIQLIDARETYVPMRRSLGDKRRKIGEGRDGEPGQIDAIVHEYDEFVDTATSKVFRNENFGYTRVTVERPLRLRFSFDTDRKARFLDSFPGLLDDLSAVQSSLGRETSLDWNRVLQDLGALLRQRGAKWTAAQKKVFRDVFSDSDPTAEAVQVVGGAKEGAQFEPDPTLRDFENIPLTTSIDDFFATEVAPHVPDAWMDRSKDKVGYEINFNRHFYLFIPPRPLAEIDSDLKAAEERIMILLNEVAR